MASSSLFAPLQRDGAILVLVVIAAEEPRVCRSDINSWSFQGVVLLDYCQSTLHKKAAARDVFIEEAKPSAQQF